MPIWYAWLGLTEDSRTTNWHAWLGLTEDSRTTDLGPDLARLSGEGLMVYVDLASLYLDVYTLIDLYTHI